MTGWLIRLLSRSCRWCGLKMFVCSCGKGGGSTTTVTTVAMPPKSQEELDLMKKQNELLDIQIGELRRQNEALQAVFPQQKELLGAQLTATTALVEAQKAQTARIERLAALQEPVIAEQLALQRETLPLQRAQLELQQALLREVAKPETPEQKELRELSEKRALAYLKGEAPPLSEAQRERIGTVFGEAETDAERGLREFAEELAASRGLRLTDTPIGGEVLERRAELARTLGGARARAELDVGRAEQEFTEGVRQFQEGLRQRAFMNRLALTTGQLPSAVGAALPTFGVPWGGGGVPGFTTGGAGELFGSVNPMLSRLAQERLAGSATTQTGRTSGGGFNWMATLQPAAVLGAAGIGLLSSRKYKRAIRPLDPDEYERALRKITDTPIVRYRYRWERDEGPPHIGPILELSPPEITDDGETVNLLDYSGLLHAAIKGLQRRTARVEAALDTIAEAA